MGQLLREGWLRNLYLLQSAQWLEVDWGTRLILNYQESFIHS